MDHESTLRPNEILKTIAYFDVFRYPLTREEIYNFLPRNSVTRPHVYSLVQRMAEEGILNELDGYFFLPPEDAEVVRQRIGDESRARRMMRYARSVSFLLKQFPFTRAVFITGSLSKNVAAADSDIDFLIVTAGSRLWICKTILTLFRRLFLLGSHKYFCTNFYVSEKNYTVPGRTLYTAIELLTAKAMWNVHAFLEFQEANLWARDLLPNCYPVIDPAQVLGPNRSVVQRFLEGLMELFPLDTLNRRLMDHFEQHWKKANPEMTDEERKAAFCTTPGMSTVWKIDYQGLIMEQYRLRLARLGMGERHE